MHVGTTDIKPASAMRNLGLWFNSNFTCQLKYPSLAVQHISGETVLSA